MATTNLLSCNGPEFVMQLSFHVKDSNGLKVGSGNMCIICHDKHLPSISLKSCYRSALYSLRSIFSGPKSFLEAHARLRCVYFPVVQVKLYCIVLLCFIEPCNFFLMSYRYYTI